MNNGRLLLILVLLSILFFVNIPLSNIEKIKTKLTGNDVNQTSLNLTPFVQLTNRTTIFVDDSGKEIGSVTQQYNETIIPEVPKQTTDIKTTISKLGEKLYPSNPLIGWVIIGLVAYFIILPLLKWLKELIGF